MTREQLINEIFSKQTYLCVGLDTDISKIPKYLQSHPDAIYEFNGKLCLGLVDLYANSEAGFALKSDVNERLKAQVAGTIESFIETSRNRR